MDRRASGGAVKRAAGGSVILRAKGGAAKRADGGDVSSIEEANRDQAMSADKRARGGRTSKKGGHTHVNVIVAPQGGGAGAGPVPPIALGGGPGGPMPPVMPPRPPMASPMGAGPMMPPPGGLPPGMPPPGMMPPRASGGRVQRAKGGAVHDDEAQDKALIKKELKAEGLARSDKAERADGGRLVAPKRLPSQKHHLDAGAVTGVARLEKIGKKPHDAGKPQPV